VNDYDMLEAKNPKEIVRDLEFKLREECMKARYEPPAGVTVELQGCISGGFDLSLTGFLGKRKKICALVNAA
jgi:hypothetical protein